MTTPNDGADSAATPAEPNGVTDRSSVVGVVRRVSGRLGTSIRASALYNWFTKEPEPDVIVIDLRETRTIGPAIALLDRLIAWLAPHWRQSRIHDGVVTLERACEWVGATRTGRLLARLLLPPDPPAGHNRRE